LTWIDAISIAGAVVSLVISVFAIWLSWQFYTEARAQSDRVSEAVSAIQISVTSVQTAVENVVSRTVESLLGGQLIDPAQALKAESKGAIEELKKKIDELAKKNQDAPQGIIDLIEKVVNDQERLSKDIEARLRVVTLGEAEPPAEPKVRIVRKSILRADGSVEEGEIDIEVRQPLRVATVTDFVQSDIGSLGKIEVRLESSPTTSPPPRLSSGIGNTARKGEFNVHLTVGIDSTIEPGVYTVFYRAFGQSAWWRRTFGP
jgi:hypothetical protein